MCVWFIIWFIIVSSERTLCIRRGEAKATSRVRALTPAQTVWLVADYFDAMFVIIRSEYNSNFEGLFNITNFFITFIKRAYFSAQFKKEYNICSMVY